MYTTSIITAAKLQLEFLTVLMCLIYSESLDILPFCRIYYLWVKRMLYAIQHDDTKRSTIKTEIRAVSRRYRHGKAITGTFIS